MTVVFGLNAVVCDPAATGVGGRGLPVPTQRSAPDSMVTELGV